MGVGRPGDTIEERGGGDGHGSIEECKDIPCHCRFYCWYRVEGSYRSRWVSLLFLWDKWSWWILAVHKCNRLMKDFPLNNLFSTISARYTNRNHPTQNENLNCSPTQSVELAHSSKNLIGRRPSADLVISPARIHTLPYLRISPRTNGGWS